LGGQVDRKSASAELLVTLHILYRGQRELFNPARFLPFCRSKAIESMNQPTIGRHDVSMRDDVIKLASISEHADQKIVLAGLCADQQAKAALVESPKSDPVAPR
jgi:hypothetical protein